MSLVDEPGTDLPASARSVLVMLVDQLRALDSRVARLDRGIIQRARENKVARRLMTSPGIDAVTAAAITALAPSAETFRRGRDFAAWIGLTPIQRSTGGKERLGRITRMGDRTIRRLLIIGASAVARWGVRNGAPAWSWLSRMLGTSLRWWCGYGRCWPGEEFIRPALGARACVLDPIRESHTGPRMQRLFRRPTRPGCRSRWLRAQSGRVLTCVRPLTRRICVSS
jgi:hypothetical protein